MKRILTAVLVLLLALNAAGPALAAEEQTAMRIVSCPEQDFSTLIRPEYDYDYSPDGGLMILLGEGDGAPFVTVFKADAPGADFDAEYYFTNVYRERLNSYGDELTSAGEFTTFPLGGKDLPGRMAMYLSKGEGRFVFCGYDLEEDYFVRYEAFCPQTEDDIEEVLEAVGTAVRYFQPDAGYYAQDSFGSTGDDALPGGTDDGDALFSENGFTVYLTDYETFKSTGSTADTYLNAHVVNNTDSTLSLRFSDASIDGVGVLVTGFLLIEPHSEGESSALVFAPSENKEAASDAIANAQTLTATLTLKEKDSDEALAVRTVTIDLTSLEGEKTIMTPTPAPTATPSPTPVPTTAPTAPPVSSSGRATAPAYTPASYDFQTLTQGKKGQAVKDLQQRLTDLGFLNDVVDGEYGVNTATAVRSFCDQHGLSISNDATPEMQRLLYSSSAEYYVEPYIPLIFGPNYKWNNPMDARQDIGEFYIQLVNRCPDRTIRGYELYFYLTNVWGDVIENSDGAWLTPVPEQHTIRPGYVEYSKVIMVYPFSYAYSVWIGIHKIVFDDGEIREVDPDDIVYFECPVKK